MFHNLGDERAHHQLYDFVENYFNQDITASARNVLTNRPPIYLQQPGHSLTIVGLERHRDGARNLLVFDPGFGPSKDIRSLIGKREVGRRIHSRDTEKLMHAYRRTSARLGKYKGFETVS